MRLVSLTALVSVLSRDRLYLVKAFSLVALLLIPFTPACAGTWQARANDPVYSCSASGDGGDEIYLLPGGGPNQYPSAAPTGRPSRSPARPRSSGPGSRTRATPASLRPRT